MVEVIVLTCPVCGARLEPNTDRCSYCGSVIILKTDHAFIDSRLINKAVIDQRIAEYRRAVRQDQYNETAHYGLGVAYFNLGLYEEAVDELSQAARLMPENPNIQAQLAVILRESAKRGNEDAERRMYSRIETALKLDPHHIETLMLQAELLRESGKLDRAVGKLREIYPLAPDRVRPKLINCLLDWSQDLTKYKQWDQVVQRWEELGELDQDKAKQAMVYFLSFHKRAIPRMVADGALPKSGFVKTLGVGAGILLGLVSGVIVLVVTAVIAFYKEQGPTGWGIALFLFGLVLLLASPVIGGFIAKKRMKSASGVIPEKVDREQVLAGQAPFLLTTKVVQAVIQKLESKAAK